MAIQGVDLASPVSAQHAEALAKAGKRFVCRYLAPLGGLYDWKRVTAGEIAGIHAAGMSVVFVFESAATRALEGHGAGLVDGLTAAQALKGLAAPLAQPVYFAVDFDATVSDQAAINGYLAGAEQALGKGRVGIYGGYYPVNRALNAAVCSWAWQTYAWSGGQWDSRAQLRQYQNGQSVAGLSVDLDEAVVVNYGQWDPRVVTRPARGWVVRFTNKAGKRVEARTLHPVLWHSRNPRATSRGPLSFDRN